MIFSFYPGLQQHPQHRGTQQHLGGQSHHQLSGRMGQSGGGPHHPTGAGVPVSLGQLNIKQEMGERGGGIVHSLPTGPMAAGQTQIGSPGAPGSVGAHGGAADQGTGGNNELMPTAGGFVDSTTFPSSNRVNNEIFILQEELQNGIYSLTYFISLLIFLCICSKTTLFFLPSNFH